MTAGTTFYFKRTPRHGYRVWSSLIEASEYKGMSAWAKTRKAAMEKLIDKFNQKSRGNKPNYISYETPAGQVTEMAVSLNLEFEKTNDKVNTQSKINAKIEIETPKF